jgi:hypothetical protein
MEPFTTVSGPNKDFERGKAFSFGKTVASMKAIGKETKPMATEDSFTLMATVTTEIGSTIRRMVVEPTSIWTVPSTSATGKRINNTAMVSKLGQMLPNMRATTNSAKSMESVPLSGPTDQPILENSIITISMEKVFTLGPTTASTKVNGEPTKCTVKELLPGLTEESISVSTPRTRKRAMESSYGLMVAAIEANGSTENSMVRAPTSLVLAKKNTVNGKTEKELDGLVEEKWTESLFHLLPIIEILKSSLTKKLYYHVLNS